MMNLKRFEYEPKKTKAISNGKHQSVKRELSSCDEQNEKKLKKLNNGIKAVPKKRSDFISTSSGSEDETNNNLKENHVIPTSLESQQSFNNSFDSPIIKTKSKKSKFILDSDESFQDSEKFNSIIPSSNGHLQTSSTQSSESPLKLKKRARKKLLNFSSSESDSDNNTQTSTNSCMPVATGDAKMKKTKKEKPEKLLKVNGTPSIAVYFGKSTAKKSEDVRVNAADYTIGDDDFSIKDRIRTEHYDEDDTSDEENIDGISQEKKNKILEFMQTSTIEELSTINQCSATTSKRIVECRPFTSWSELKTKISSSKVIGRAISVDAILWRVEELLQERVMLQELMDKCSILTDKINKEVEEMQMTHTSCNEKFVSKQPPSIPASMKLKEFQMVGLNWLALLHRQGLSGILADEMGLGKTVQAISFLAYLFEQNTKHETHVVVVPSSTLKNWQREFQTWCPKLCVTMYYGSQEERRNIREDYLKKRVHTDVFLSTYNLTISLIDDRVFFRKMSLGYAIFDEGHMLKNMSSQRYQKLMKIQAKRRLLLTGTPLQNNLLELMSMLRFVMPDMFNETTETLVRLFISGNAETKSAYAQKCIAQAKTLIEPFMLRRLKEEVLQELPDKVHKIVYCNMTKSQQILYKNTCAKYKNKNVVKLASSDMKNAFMELRKIANHPLLCRHHYVDSELRTIAKKLKKDQRYWDSNEHYIFEDMQVMTDFEMHNLCITHHCVKSHALSNEAILNSGKLKQLDEILAQYQNNGKRVLMFSQFTMMMDIFEAYLKIRGHKYLRLDGKTAVDARLQLIDEFNNDPTIFIFILSTKAGGLGINLTSASVVLLHDIDFNPYNDKQAEDRCHRVGQTQTVEIVRMLSKDSIEEGMLALAANKLQLEQDITNTDEAIPVADILKEALGL